MTAVGKKIGEKAQMKGMKDGVLLMGTSEPWYIESHRGYNIFLIVILYLSLFEGAEANQ